MQLKVSKRRKRYLGAALKASGRDVKINDRERRYFVKQGALDATPADLARVEAAAAKRQRKAAKVVCHA